MTYFHSSLANKQDKAEAMDRNAILEDLNIERLVNENQSLCHVVSQVPSICIFLCMITVVVIVQHRKCARQRRFEAMART
jgi:hypothetical protein